MTEQLYWGSHMQDTSHLHIIGYYYRVFLSNVGREITHARSRSKSRKTWHSNFQNLFITQVAWISFGFIIFIDRIEDPSLLYLIQGEKYEVCRGFNERNGFGRTSLSSQRTKPFFFITTRICSPWRCLWSRHKLPVYEGINQDVTPQQAKACNKRVDHEYPHWKYEKQNTTKRQGRILADIIAQLQDASRP